MLKFLFLTILIIFSTSTSYAKDSPEKLLSAWSTHCDDIDNNRWFALVLQGENNYMFKICAGFKCIPYPGFWKPFDVYKDQRVKWVSDSEMKISNNDKDAGWEGYITFNRCQVY